MTEPAGPPSPPPRGKGRTRVAAALGVALALVLGGVVYAGLRPGKAGTDACRSSVATADRLGPLATGEVAALGIADPVRPAVDLSFDGPDGQRTSLAAFRGRTVLLNVWATWCAPCRKEMPALDRLQQKRGGADFQVVAINADTAKLERPQAFLKEAGITALPLYADPSGAVFAALRADGQALGLPTTLLIDPQGCELGVMAGPAAWDSPDADRLIEAATARTAPRG